MVERTHVRPFPFAVVALTVAVDALFTAIWFLSTAVTGKTYHFDPLIIAVAPSMVFGVARGRRARGIPSVAPAIVGSGAVSHDRIPGPW